MGYEKIRNPNLKYRWWGAVAMYTLMAIIGAHCWVLLPVEVCPIPECYRRELHWIQHAPKPLSTMQPQKSQPKFAQVLRGGMAPMCHFHKDIYVDVQREITSLRSSLSAMQAISLVARSQHKVPVSTWNRLFQRVATRVRKETTFEKVWFHNTFCIRLPSPSPHVCQQMVHAVKGAISSSYAPRGLKQFHLSRVVPAPMRTATIGQRLYNIHYDFNRARFNMTLHSSCPCNLFPTLTCPPPLNHIIIRGAESRLAELYPDCLHIDILRQCMTNATAPRHGKLVDAVNHITKTVCSAIPRFKGRQWCDLRNPVFDRGEDIFEQLLHDADARILPQHVAAIRNKHQCLHWGPLDKKTGHTVGACSVVRAQLFEQHFLLSPRYQVLHEFDSVQEASSLILSNLAEMASQLGLSRFVKRSSRKSAAPHGFLYIKHKSDEMSGVLQVRPILSHAGHILRGLSSDISRCLTILTKLYSQLDSNLEVLTMPERTTFFKKAQKISTPMPLLQAREIGELDVEDMYINIPKDALLPAFDAMIQYIHNAEPNTHRRRVRFDCVSISKFSKFGDKHGRAPRPEDYTYYPLAFIRKYIEFELTGNHLFRAGSFVLAQHIGIPMGGKLSAQLSSMYLMYRESLNVNKSLFGPKVLCARYKDHLYFSGPAGSVIPCLESWMKVLATAYAMPLQLGGTGGKIECLEALLDATGAALSVSLRRKVVDGDAVKHIWRWPDPWSGNIQYLLRSLIPGVAAKVPLWSLSESDMALNVTLIATEVGFKGYQCPACLQTFSRELTRHDIRVPWAELLCFYDRGRALAMHLRDMPLHVSSF